MISSNLSIRHAMHVFPQVGHIDSEGRDLDWRAEGFTESRCMGGSGQEGSRSMILAV
jgi:hypothetical protein